VETVTERKIGNVPAVPP